MAKSISSDISSSILSPCTVKELDMFFKRQAKLHKADKYVSPLRLLPSIDKSDEIDIEKEGKEIIGLEREDAAKA